MAHVLMIDDDADFIEANRTVLEANGFEVSAAYSAQEGWDILQGATPDVIILDNMMPGGGYCFAPTHCLQDNSPTENVVAMYETAHQVGTY